MLPCAETVFRSPVGPGVNPRAAATASSRGTEIITNSFSLLEGSVVEPQLLQLVAHASAYRVLLQR